MEHEEGLAELLVHSTHEFGLHLTESQIAQFMCYLSQLILWNKITNLTSITGREDIVIKHFIDSLTALAAATFPEHATLVDVGTGGGFPGIPLKIARSDLKLVLVEPNHKKCSFLASVVGLLRLQDTDISRGSIQTYAADKQSSAELATVRALSFRQIRKPVQTVIAPNGQVILYKAKKLDPAELGSGFLLQSEKEFSLPHASGQRVISVLAPTASC